MPPEMQGAFSSKGWDKKTPLEAALESMKSYQEVEKHLGVPKDQLARIPKDANDKEGWATLNRRLGMPEAADKYDFSKVKHADGADLKPEFVKELQTAFWEDGVGADRASNIVSKLVKHLDASGESDKLIAQGELAKQKDIIKTEWKGREEANMFIAKQAVERLGLNKDTVEALEKTSGYAVTMQALLKIGQAMGESKFVTNDADPAKGTLSREQASAKMNELKRDSIWVDRFNKGGVKENQEHDALARIAAGI